MTLLCNACNQFYPEEEVELIDDGIVDMRPYCKSCIALLYPKGEYKTVDAHPCFICHRPIPHYLLVDIEIYIDETQTYLKHICPVCKNGNGLKDVTWAVAQCYTCGRFFDPDMGLCIDVKWKVGPTNWVTVDRWLCSTHAALI